MVKILKELLLEQFNNKYCSLNDIVRVVEKYYSFTPRETIIWNVNDLVKNNQITRVGRGIFFFGSKKQFRVTLSDTAKSVCAELTGKLKYLEITITDTSYLHNYMQILPFSSVIIIEVDKVAVRSVLSILRAVQFNAWAKEDLAIMEKYSSVTQQPEIIRSELSANPSLLKENNINYTNIEKLLVDVVCDEKVFSQYQGDELYNIFSQFTDIYAINYSKMLRYATARNRQEKVVEILSYTNEFIKVRDLL